MDDIADPAPAQSATSTPALDGGDCATAAVPLDGSFDRSAPAIAAAAVIVVARYCDAPLVELSQPGRPPALVEVGAIGTFADADVLVRGMVHRVSSADGLHLQLMPRAATGEAASGGATLVSIRKRNQEAVVSLRGKNAAGNRISSWAMLEAVIAGSEAGRADPETDCGNLNLVTPRLHETLLQAAMGEVMELPHATILDQFEGAVRSYPSRTAVIADQRSLTYSELDAEATALTGQILSCCPDRDGFVPIALGNRLELPVALIAAMRCAMPFAVLDKDWPAARLQSALERIGARMVLCAAEDVLALPAEPPPLIVALGASAQTASTCRPTRPTPDDPIYGFFTSGSTGVPKCAMNLHRGLLNRFSHMSKRFLDGSENVVLQNSNFVFDSSLWQLLWPLTSGGTVVIPGAMDRGDVRRTVALIEQHGITMTDFVPSVFRILVEAADRDPELRRSLQSLRTLLIGGEEVNQQAVSRFRDICPGVRIVNTYGPTEASIGMIFHEVRPGERSIPLGKPISNCFAIIVDRHLRPLPPGMIGEIAIGGMCLGAGYLGDQRKTDEVFKPNPFPELPGSQIYLTGDLGYLTSEQTFQYLVRKDFEIKLGGVRINLTEIEAVLCQHEEVRTAVVLVQEIGAGHKTLAAFVVANEGAASTELVAEIRAMAADRLPIHQVPRDVRFVNHVPLTSNGKLDRRALQALLQPSSAGPSSPAPGAPYPEASTLHRLSSIWSRLLGQTVMPTADFTALGGDSLLAMELAVAIQHDFGLHVQVADILRFPLLSEQAGWLERGARSDSPDLARKAVRRSIAADTAPGNDLPSAWPSHDGRVETVLLTGATGFVGAHILADLLARPGLRIRCLTRAHDAAAGRARLRDAFYHFGLPVRDIDRVALYCGALEAPRLGLSGQGWRELGADTDAIVHCGATVTFLQPYEQLRLANVYGTRTLLSLAADGCAKLFHHVSTLAVTAGPVTGVILEEELAPGCPLPDTGYGQTKLAAERLVTDALSRGLHGHVYRLGEMMPAANRGRPNPTALTTMLLQACLMLGCYPETGLATDFTPVDQAARFVTDCLTNVPPANPAPVYHVFRPGSLRLDRLVEQMANGLWGAPPIAPMAYSDFLARLATVRGKPGFERFEMLAAMLPEPGGSQDVLADLLHDPTPSHSVRLMEQRRDEFGWEWEALSPRQLAEIGKEYALSLGADRIAWLSA